MGVIYKNDISYGGGASGGGGSGSSDYNDLSHKPSINGVTLAANQTASDLNLTDETTITTDTNGKLKVISPSFSGETIVFP